MKYLEEIEARKAKLSAIIKAAQEQLKDAPEGQLRSRKDGNALRFYCRRTGETNGEYLSLAGEDIDLVRKLAQKKYAQKVLTAADCELGAIEGGESYILKHLPERKAEEVFDCIDPGVRSITTPIEDTDDLFAEQWQNRKFRYSGRFEDERTFTTKRGEKVRSKSERMIADVLFDEGVPYKYECPLIVGGVTLHPDFTLLDKRARCEIYWEHFGMVDDESYAVNAFKRIYLYCATGAAGMGNLIITCEAGKAMPFDAPNVLSILVARGLISPDRLAELSRRQSMNRVS